MDGLFHGPSIYKWMIWGYPYFRKSPYVSNMCIIVDKYVDILILIQLRTLAWLLCCVFVCIYDTAVDLDMFWYYRRWLARFQNLAKRQTFAKLEVCWTGRLTLLPQLARGYRTPWQLAGGLDEQIHQDSNWMGAIGGCKNVWLYVLLSMIIIYVHGVPWKELGGEVEFQSAPGSHAEKCFKIIMDQDGSRTLDYRVQRRQEPRFSRNNITLW